MNQNTKRKKITAAVTILLFLFSSLLPLKSEAILVEFISDIASDAIDWDYAADTISSRIEQRYGFDQDIWLKAKRKESAPRVEVFFDNTNPKPGEKVTAHAVPEYFKNDPQNLYYTWYVIHTTDGRSQTATNSITSGKIEAAKWMSRGDYDPDLDGQEYGDSDKDPDADGWPAVDTNSYDEDETAAPMGGADGVGGLAEETVETFSSATEWCDSLGNHTWDKCSYNDTDAVKPLDTYFTLKSAQTNHYCDLCKDYFSGDGLSAYNSAKSTRNSCCYNNITATDCVDGDGNPIKCPYDSSTDYCGVTYDSNFAGCYDSFKETNKSTVSTCLTTEFDSCKTDWGTVHQDTNGDGFSDLNEEDTTQVSRCYKHDFGTNANASIFRENELASGVTDDSSGLDISISCKHKWPNATDYKSGSGKFPTGEEEYWKTDPADPDTDGDGSPDEADVIGLNQQSFTWNYQTGDRVGVVVEGTSMIPTDEKNAYYKIMWGHLDVCDATKTHLLDDDGCDDSDDYGFGFFATKSPSEQGEDRLKISLSYSPDNPLADPSSENADNILGDGTITDADEISVLASLDNTDYNPSELYYTWQISKGDPSKDDWSEVKNIEDNFNTSSPASGMGIFQFNFAPKKDVLSGSGDIVYFKVTLTAGKASDLEAGRGRSSVIVPVNKKGIRITLHEVNVAGGKASIGEEICDEGLYKSLCPVVRGQMLAARVSGSHYAKSDSQFSWKINGVAHYPPANASQLFSGWSDTAIFLPITKEEQEIEEISVTATARDELLPATGVRFATVVRPALFIKSSDTSVSWPKIYAAESPTQKSVAQNIESSTAFEALTGSTASYYLDFVPYYLLGEDSNSQIDWLVNGTSIFSPDFYENNPYLGHIGLENNNRTIKMPVDGNQGAFASLSAEVQKFWSDDERSIAYSAWGIAPETLAGETSVSIESVDAAGDTIGSANNPGQILAAIGTHLPHYFMYLLRLALTMAVMFVVSAGFYGLTQKLNLANEEK